MCEVIVEAWVLMIEKKLWRAKFRSESEAIDQLDSGILKDIRSRSQRGRTRKEKHAAEIREQRGEIVKDWHFGSIGEHQLRYISEVSRHWSFSEPLVFVAQIALRRLRSGQSGRGSSRQLITNDWMDFGLLLNYYVQLLLDKGLLSDIELAIFEMTKRDIEWAIDTDTQR